MKTRQFPVVQVAGVLAGAALAFLIYFSYQSFMATNQIKKSEAEVQLPPHEQSKPSEPVRNYGAPPVERQTDPYPQKHQVKQD